MERLQTAGEIQNDLLKKESDSYSVYDLGYAITEGIGKEVLECVEKHLNTFQTNRFCVVCQLATDPLLKAVLRRKFYGWPYLPCPQPGQSVWLYDDGPVTFLWSLPDAYTMIKLSETLVVPLEYTRMKKWCHWYYDLTFWTNIRKEHGIDMLSESEFTSMTRKEGGHFIEDDSLGLKTDSFYLPEIRIKKLEAKANSSFSKSLDDQRGKANTLDRNIQLHNF